MKKQDFFFTALLKAGFLISFISLFNVVNAQTYLCYKDVNNSKCIYDSVLYIEGWHELPQTKFWQQIMELPPDSAIVSVAQTRQILDKISMKEWKLLSESQQTRYRDELRNKNCIADSIALFVP